MTLGNSSQPPLTRRQVRELAREQAPASTDESSGDAKAEDESTEDKSGEDRQLLRAIEVLSGSA